MVRIALLIAAVGLASTQDAQAYQPQAGSTEFHFQVGGSHRQLSRVGTNDGFFTFAGDAVHYFDPSVSATAGLALSLTDTQWARARFGLRYRFPGMGSPWAPWVGAQFVVGRLFHALGSDITALGVRPMVGADYQLDRTWSWGFGLGWEVTSTLGDNSARFTLFDWFLTVGYAL